MNVLLHAEKLWGMFWKSPKILIAIFFHCWLKHYYSLIIFASVQHPSSFHVSSLTQHMFILLLSLGFLGVVVILHLTGTQCCHLYFGWQFALLIIADLSRELHRLVDDSKQYAVQSLTDVITIGTVSIARVYRWMYFVTEQFESLS